MNYTVDWSVDAQSTLTAIWLQAPDRSAVTAASAEIDRRLAANPLGNGTVVSEGLYAIEVHPLRALFEVSDTDRIVRVVSVNRLP
jgi:predicted RNase H-like nuclease